MRPLLGLFSFKTGPKGGVCNVEILYTPLFRLQLLPLISHGKGDKQLANSPHLEMPTIPERCVQNHFKTMLFRLYFFENVLPMFTATALLSFISWHRAFICVVVCIVSPHILYIFNIISFY